MLLGEGPVPVGLGAALCDRCVVVDPPVRVSQAVLEQAMQAAAQALGIARAA